MKYRLTLTVDVDDTNIDEVLNYVNDAVGNWGGQYQPDDPFFDLEVTRVEGRDHYLDLDEEEGT